MNKKFFSILPLLIPFTAICSCKKQIDYADYISEMRYAVYLYGDDILTLKIYMSEREVPYALNGICGKLSPLTEVYVTFTSATPQKVSILADELSGELSYQTAKNQFSLSIGKTFDRGSQINLTLTYDKTEQDCTALAVLSEGNLTCKQALNCTAEYAAERFTALTKNGNLEAEIAIRLLYDEGCWYYVGITDRNKTTYAYLLDASDGKIIATRTITN